MTKEQLGSMFCWADYPPVGVADFESPGTLPFISGLHKTHRFSDEILDSMVICYPPMNQSGEIMPLSDRPDRPAQMSSCNPMTVARAEKAFPKRYVDNPYGFFPQPQ
jgi:hypothetical protein